MYARDPSLNAIWSVISNMLLRISRSGDSKGSNPYLALSTVLCLLRTFSNILEGGALLLFAPWVAEWFPKLSGYTKLRSLLEDFVQTFQKPVDEHIKSYSELYERWGPCKRARPLIGCIGFWFHFFLFNCRDFADAFLKEIYATKNVNSAFYGKLGGKP